jgi:hypothetical protein
MSKNYILEIVGIEKLQKVRAAFAVLADYVPCAIVLEYSDATKITKVQIPTWATDAIVQFMNDFNVGLNRCIDAQPRNTLA